MKKQLFRLLAALLALVLVLSLAGCGGKKETAEPEPSEIVSSEVKATPAPTKVPAINSETGKYTSIKTFLDSDMMQEQLESMREQLGEDSGMSIELKSEGEKLIYLFTYGGTSLEGVDETILGSTLNSALDSMASTFENVASSLLEAVEVTDPTVEVTYQKEDGTVLCTREFTPTE